MSVWCPVDGTIDGEQCFLHGCAGMRCGKLEKMSEARMQALYIAVSQLRDEFDVRPHLGKEGGYIACKWGYKNEGDAFRTIIADGIGQDAVEALINLARELREHRS